MTNAPAITRLHLTFWRTDIMERTISNIQGSRRGGPGALGRLVGLVAFSRSRHRLCELEDHMLRDIGLTREQARQEAARSAWNAPAHWLR
jgi:uncharacterized protein YjiS (DUF1127 family)